MSTTTVTEALKKPRQDTPERQQLIRRAQRGDPAAMAELLEAYRGLFFWCLQRFFHNRRGVPFGAFWGEIWLCFMRCVQAYKPEIGNLANYCRRAIRTAIYKQWNDECWLVWPATEEEYLRPPDLKKENYAYQVQEQRRKRICKRRARRSWKWQPPSECRTDRRWNGKPHLVREREDRGYRPEWLSDKELEQLLKSLEARQRQVLLLRSRGKDLLEIGSYLQVTSERVRQIEARALRDLRMRANYHNTRKQKARVAELLAAINKPKFKPQDPNSMAAMTAEMFEALTPYAKGYAVYMYGDREDQPNIPNTYDTSRFNEQELFEYNSGERQAVLHAQDSEE